MRPVVLRFAGLRSYRNETVIDFSELNLFAVIGDTGAGKSTIVEALCLALYAKRSWSGGVLADVICDGVDTMRVEFTFAVGEDTYSVTRVRHRGSGASMDRLLDANGTPVADGTVAVTKKVEELIGLNFAQFTQAVVLPQGQFDKLLRATETERNKILTTVLDLGGVVEARKRVDQLLREWKPRTDELKGRRSGYPPDPTAALAAAQQRADSARLRSERLADALKATTALIEDQQRVAQRVGALNAAVAQLRPIPAGTEAALAAVASKWGDLEAAKARVVGEGRGLQAALRECDDAVAAALGGFECRDAIVAARVKAASAAEQLPAALDAHRRLVEQLDALKAAPPSGEADPVLRSSAEEAASRHEVAAAAAKQASDRLGEARRLWDQILECRLALTAVAGVVGDLDEQMQHAVSVERSAAKRLVEATAAAEAASVAERTEALAGAVHDLVAGCEPGSPCPVCERPLPEDFTSERPASGAAQMLAEETAAQRRLAAEAAAEAEKNRILLGERLDAQRLTLDTQRRLSRTLAAAAVEAGLDTVAGDTEAVLAALVDTEREALAAQAATGAERAAAHNALIAAGTVAAGRLASYQGDLKRCESDAADLQRRIRAHGADLAAFPRSWLTAFGDTFDEIETARLLVEACDAATAELDRIDARRAELADRRQMLLGCHSDLDAKIASAVTGALNSAFKDIADHVESVRRLAEAMGAEDAPLCSADMVQIPKNPAELARRVEPLGAALCDAAALQVLAAKTIGELDSDSAEISAAILESTTAAGCADPEELRTAIGAAVAERSYADTELAQAAAQRSEAARLDAVLALASPFCANLALLSESLRDSFFVAHLVDARERELLGEAARRLTDISGGRFTFAKDFGVISVASGEKRPPDALSGGERFQAALALALALVEIASRGAGRLDAVFVDEGFGSLDANALDVALATLANIAGDGKSVALISHLRPVAEYVDTVLHVTKDDMFGSRIVVLDSEARDQMLDDEIRSGLTA